MRPGAVAGILSAILMAGCFGGGGTTGLTDVDFTSDAGLLVGVVVDTELFPIAGARAHIEGAGNTTAGQDGVFRLTNVSTGSHQVLVEADGYASTTAELHFAPGETVEQTFILERVSSDVPYADLQIQSGLINCGWALVLHAAFCGGDTVSPVFGEFRAQLEFPVPDSHRLVVVETDWEQRSQTMHKWLWDGAGLDNRTFLADALGQAVLRKELVAGQLHPSFYEAASVEHTRMRDGVPFLLMVQTFYDGAYQETTNATAGAVCEHTVLGYCSGLGVAIEWRFDQYVTSFVHRVPAGAATYSAVPDR